MAIVSTTLIALLFSCVHESMDDLPRAMRLQSIISVGDPDSIPLWDSTAEISELEYNSSGQLVRLTDDNLQIDISFDPEGNLLFKVDGYTWIMTGLSGTKVEQMTFFNTDGDTAGFYRFYYGVNGMLESVENSFEFSYYWPFTGTERCYDSRIVGIEYDGNTTRIIHQYTCRYDFTAEEYYSDTIHVGYNTLPNIFWAPQQLPLYRSGSLGAVSLLSNLHTLEIISLLGYHAFEPNENLVASSGLVEYSYELNDDLTVSKMTVDYPDGYQPDIVVSQFIYEPIP